MALTRSLFKIAGVLLIVGGVVFGLIVLSEGDEAATAFRRELVVEIPRETAWRHFAKAKAWPSWATYIERVDVVPDTELGAVSVATIHLGKGPSTAFEMVEWEPYEHWRWSTKVLWFSLNYNHIFEVVDERRTRIVLHMGVDGPGKSLFARLIGRAAAGDLDAAIPRLVAEMNGLR